MPRRRRAERCDCPSSAPSGVPYWVWLHHLGRRVSAAGNLSELLEVVYEGVRFGLGYDRAGVYLFGGEAGTAGTGLRTDARGHTVAMSGREAARYGDGPPAGCSGITALSGAGEVYYTADAMAAWPRDLRDLLDGEPAQCLMVPLRAGETPLGMIWADNLLSRRTIAPAEAAPLPALADQAAMALEMMRLQQRERAERGRLEALLETARALTSTLDRDQILHELARRLVLALGAANAAFTQVDQVARLCKSLVHYAVPGCAPLFDDDPWEPLDDYPELEEVLRTGRPFHGRLDDPGFPEAEARYLQRHGLCAELLVPLITRGETLGALEVHWDRPEEIGAETVALCLAIAEQGAVALENARLYAEAEARAERDALTGLLNHRATIAALDQELERAHRYRRPCAVLFLDLDHFKALNDGYGHPAGDAALHDLAAIMRRTLRGIDVLGRWGGEEFVVILPETAPEAALVAAEYLRAAVAAHTFAAGCTRLTCSIGVAAYPHDAEERDGLIAAADTAMYAAKRLGRNQVRSSSDQATAMLVAGVAGEARDEALIGTVEALAALVEARDHYTGQHTQAVAPLCVRVALTLGLDTAEARLLGLLGRLHDIGKVAVPDAVLQKPARLSEDEWAFMRVHPLVGAEVVSYVPALRALAPLIRAHHERWDGAGYPDGLAGAAIPLGARVVAVADAYRAMTSDRPYRPACSAAQALAELRRCAGTQFDPTVVAALERLLAADPSAALHRGAA